MLVQFLAFTVVELGGGGYLNLLIIYFCKAVGKYRSGCVGSGFGWVINLNVFGIAIEGKFVVTNVVLWEIMNGPNTEPS